MTILSYLVFKRGHNFRYRVRLRDFHTSLEALQSDLARDRHQTSVQMLKVLQSLPPDMVPAAAAQINAASSMSLNQAFAAASAAMASTSASIGPASAAVLGSAGAHQPPLGSAGPIQLQQNPPVPGLAAPNQTMATFPGAQGVVGYLQHPGAMAVPSSVTPAVGTMPQVLLSQPVVSVPSAAAAVGSNSTAPHLHMVAANTQQYQQQPSAVVAVSSDAGRVINEKGF